MTIVSIKKTKDSIGLKRNPKVKDPYLKTEIDEISEVSERRERSSDEKRTRKNYRRPPTPGPASSRHH
jgi:hypothetical protein